jgi:hypothetical protein
MSADREALRARQRGVLDDLLAGRTPAAFDTRGTALTTRVLHGKRSAGALHVTPELAELPGWPEVFLTWSAAHPADGCAHDDVRAFVSSLEPNTPWLRLHEVYDGRRRAAWLSMDGHRVLALGIGKRVWRLRRRRRNGD